MIPDLNSQETKSSVFLNLFLNKWCYSNIIYIYPAYSINSEMTDLGKIFTITFRDFFNEIKNEGWNIFILSSPPNEIVFKKCFGSTIWDLKQKNLWAYHFKLYIHVSLILAYNKKAYWERQHWLQLFKNILNNCG